MAVLNNAARTRAKDLEGFVAHGLAAARTIGSPAYPPDPGSTRAHIPSSAASIRAVSCAIPGVMASPDRRPKLNTITARAW